MVMIQADLSPFPYPLVILSGTEGSPLEPKLELSDHPPICSEPLCKILVSVLAEEIVPE